MRKQAKKATVTVEPTPIVPDVPTKVAKGWLDNMPPMVQRFAGAVADTHSAVEKRLGFCPGKELIKAVSNGLDVLADGLHRVASRMGGAVEATPPKADESAGPATSSPESRRAQA